MGQAQAITFQEKQLDQNLCDVDYQQKEEFVWPRKQISSYSYEPKQLWAKSGYFLQGLQQELARILVKEKKHSKFSVKSLKKVLVDTKRDSSAHYVHN